MSTPAQQDAMRKIEMIMREHFHSGACIVVIRDEADRQERMETCYHGGIIQAIGLFEVGKMSLMSDGRPTKPQD